MKKKIVITLVAALLLVAMAFTLIGCSSYSKVKRTLIAEGYEIAADSTKSQDYLDAIKEADPDIEVQAYVFKKKVADDASIVDKTAAALDFGVIIEFKSSKDLEKAIGDSETIKGIIGDIQKSDLVNGNCVCISISPSFISAFKKSK